MTGVGWPLVPGAKVTLRRGSVGISVGIVGDCACCGIGNVGIRGFKSEGLELTT